MTLASGTLGPGVCYLIHFCMVIFMGKVFMASAPSLMEGTDRFLIREKSFRETVGGKTLREYCVTRTN